MMQVFSRLARAFLLSGLVANTTAVEAAWTEASTRHFVVYSEDRPEDTRQLAEKLERFDQALRYVSRLEDKELPPANRLTIYVMRSVGEVQSLANRTLVSFYLPKLDGSVAVVPKEYSGDDKFAQVLLFHEYSHHVMLSNFSAVWPDWLSEGLAEFYGNAATQEDGSVHIGLTADARAYSLLGTQESVTGSYVSKRVAKLPVKRLLETSSNNVLDAPQLYARGWLLVHHLNFDPARKGQLTRYLKELERGVGSVKAGSAAFGEMTALDNELDAYLRKNKFPYIVVPASEIKVGAIGLRTLTPGAQEIMPYRIRFAARDGDVDPKSAQKVASAVRAIAVRFPDDALVQVALSQIELDAGNYAAAAGAAERAITIDPTLIEAHIRKGAAQMAAAKSAHSSDPAVWSEVRKTLVAANHLDPNHPQPLTLFYQTFSASNQIPNANAVAALHRARELAPQIPELHLMAGFQYLLDGEVEPARKALTRYAFRPHATQESDDAIAVVETLNRVGAAGALEDFVLRGLLTW